LSPAPISWIERYGRRTEASAHFPGATISLACQVIFDVIGNLLTDGRQFKQLVLDDRIVSLLGEVPIHGRLAPQTVRPIVHTEHGTVELGAGTIHDGALLERRMRESDVASQSADPTKFSVLEAKSGLH
jgi:hypothetical protein